MWFADIDARARVADAARSFLVRQATVETLQALANAVANSTLLVNFGAQLNMIDPSLIVT